MTSTNNPVLDEAKLEAFVGQAVVDMGAAISGLLLHLGDRLGLCEPRAGDALEQNLDPVGRTHNGLSTVSCIPDSMAQEAGFRQVRRATGTPLNTILEVRP
jgi:hypothetical protein